MASTTDPSQSTFRVRSGQVPCLTKPSTSGVTARAAGAPERKFRMAIVPETLWSPGQTLKVYFYSNDLTPQKNQWIKDTASDWTNWANIKFDFVNNLPADIRVSFNAKGGNNSQIGIRARNVPADQPTMNLDPEGMTGADPDYERMTVLHEFGHALGADHEQQSPSGGIRWNPPKVYEKYAKIGWKKEDVDMWVLSYSAENTEATPLDGLSVMMYTVGPDETLDGWSSTTNSRLSQWDRQWIARHYPSNDIPICPETDCASTSWNGGRDGAAYWQDNSGCILEAKLTGDKWVTTDGIVGYAKWGSPLAAINWDEGKQIRVYAISDENQVVEFSYVPSPHHWGYKVLRDPAPPIRSDPMFSTHPKSRLAAICWYDGGDVTKPVNIRVYAQRKLNRILPPPRRL
ncbi:hypothetical protein GP486_007132 [Trichoglossum hirsutum]|uniref:Peptidase metallopeptidase domain-containing protein n=1 Tax=Trichoglossum hirsutum TaxID=265104 RepID=A0A9P8ICH0_9PEZI|nr:hypothetical protein GP486_007132 [Trichoglossum hirsutum]